MKRSKLSKVKQIAALFPILKGKEVKINPDGCNWIAIVEGWTGSYLIIKNARRARDGARINTQMIHAQSIEKIELSPNENLK